jgi:hypothetical protein
LNNIKRTAEREDEQFFFANSSHPGQDVHIGEPKYPDLPHENMRFNHSLARQILHGRAYAGREGCGPMVSHRSKNLS